MDFMVKTDSVKDAMAGWPNKCCGGRWRVAWARTARTGISRIPCMMHAMAWHSILFDMYSSTVTGMYVCTMRVYYPMVPVVYICLAMAQWVSSCLQQAIPELLCGTMESWNGHRDIEMHHVGDECTPKVTTLWRMTRFHVVCSQYIHMAISCYMPVLTYPSHFF